MAFVTQFAFAIYGHRRFLNRERMPEEMRNGWRWDRLGPDLRSQSMIKEQIPALLNEHDIMPTAQRVEIAAIMLAEEQHLSADQVLARVRQTGAAVSKATVYNTLGLLAEKGLIRQVIVDPAKVFYDSNNRPHYHFFNTNTGQLKDFDAELLGLKKLPPLPEGTVADGVDVIIRVCRG